MINNANQPTREAENAPWQSDDLLFSVRNTIQQPN